MQPRLVICVRFRRCPWRCRPTLSEELALAALAAATREFKGDPKRTHLIGVSKGGYGSWALARKYPGRFAAVVPICGGITVTEHMREQHPEAVKNSYPDEPASYAEVVQKTGKTPVWIFHGAADDRVPPDYSRKMNDALKAAGGDVHYSEYPVAGHSHNSCDKAYAEPDLMPWLLSKSLKRRLRGPLFESNHRTMVARHFFALW